MQGGGRHRTADQLYALRPGDLLPEEVAAICDLEDEHARRGHFDRIYPTQETAVEGTYAPFFEQQRFFNVLLDLWLSKWRPAMIRA